MKSEGRVPPVLTVYFHDGSKSTLWVSDSMLNKYTRGKRGSKLQNPGIMKTAGTLSADCDTYTFEDRTVVCHGGYDTECDIIVDFTYVTVCTQTEEEYDDWPSEGSADDSPTPPEPEPQPDPCATNQAQVASTFGNSTSFQNAKTQIQNAASDGKEHGISFGKDNSGNVIQSTMSTGNEHSGSVGSVPNLFADLHNHQDNNPPSSGDIYGFIDRAIAHPNYITRYVVTANGTVYALVITNKQAAINFNQNYPRQPGIGGMEPAFPEDIVDEIEMMVGWSGATIEMSTAFVLEKLIQVFLC